MLALEDKYTDKTYACWTDDGGPVRYTLYVRSHSLSLIDLKPFGGPILLFLEEAFLLKLTVFWYLILSNFNYSFKHWFLYD